MNDRQRDIVDAAVAALMAKVTGSRDDVSAALYQLVIDFAQPPPLTVPEVLRRAPVAGEVLPPSQRATWCREMTVYDV